MMESMSTESDRPSSTTAPRARTRALMAGVLVGALVAMSLTWAFSWFPESPDEEREREAEQLAEQIVEKREKAFRSPPGSCLNWSEPDASDVAEVSCDEEHLFEVVGLADVSDEYGTTAALPDAEQWRTLTDERCGELTEEYLEQPLDPEGRLSIGMLRPDDQQWEDGDRTMHCGLQWVGPGGGLQTLTEPAAETDQSYVWDTGTCLGIVDKSVGDPVSCSEAHSYEIVGVVDLRDEFEEFPTEEDQHDWLDPTCSGVLEDYTGGRNAAELAEDGLILTWDLRSEASWDAGSSLVNCKVGAVLEDDSGLAQVQGSVREGADDSGDGGDGSGDGSGDDSGDGSGEDSGGDSGGDAGDGSGDDGGGDGSGESGDGDTGGTGQEGSGSGQDGTGTNDPETANGG
ncbi:septum formation family protein [Saccharomonospora iraqiensis]|uniref:septum formation family protein n=1 Tax=Saccharomonospora iraqiensis TaxID=52698 RepID=UPI00022E03B7